MKKKYVILILTLIVLGGGFLRYLLASNFGYEEDIRGAYRVFAAKVVVKGPFELYTPDENWDVDYPPILPWLFGAMSKVFGGLGAGEYPHFKRELAILLALGDMGMIILFASIASSKSQKKALIVATVWAVNPASLFDTGYWSQPNPFDLFFACLSIWLIYKEKWFWGGVAIGIAALIKPQVWPLLPALVLWIWRDGRSKALLQGVYGCCVPIIIVWLAFLGFGRAPTLKYLFINSMASHLGLSMGAHNLWGLSLVFNQNILPAEDLWLGGINAGQIAWAITLLILGLFIWSWIWRYGKRKGLNGVEMMALWAWLFFLFSPQQHENHAMLALALTMVAWVMGMRVGWFVLSLSLVIPLNCFLHDERLLKAIFSQPTHGFAAMILTPGTYTNNLSPVTALVAIASLVIGSVWWLRFIKGREFEVSANRPV